MLGLTAQYKQASVSNLQLVPLLCHITVLEWVALSERNQVETDHAVLLVAQQVEHLILLVEEQRTYAVYVVQIIEP